MAKSRKVQVFDRGGEYFADPPVIDVAGSESVRIINHTDEELLWRVSDPAPFGAAVSEVIPKKSGSTARSPVNTPGLVGVFAYQLIGLSSGKKAKGNSDPVIIVEN
jgi:hypothetical protein